jgi:hypothetical protein
MSKFLTHCIEKFKSCISQLLLQLTTVLWLNGRASDYESGGCRFDPCQDHSLLPTCLLKNFVFATETEVHRGTTTILNNNFESTYDA